ncbi:hypothetical protein [Paenibacillus ginsengarvi]|uniref:Uncharacterized protein n=1 Tax=Paenibacillus ginsengarvi TaxID=400777 RepID=A0A3B0C7L0_9BACL|nr:hypothetical protein [Paenibacillus ginsengarvi]RKN80514.1 hypothetical protein D7M11_20455 [Paenibacillus ginsengarvi]
MRLLGNVTQLLIRMIQSGPEQPLLISPPRHWLLLRLLRHWAGLFGIVFMSYSFFIMISFPLFVYLLFTYYVLSRDWWGHGYSRVLLHSSSSVVWIVSILLAGPLRTYIGTVLGGI